MYSTLVFKLTHSDPLAPIDKINIHLFMYNILYSTTYYYRSMSYDLQYVRKILHPSCVQPVPKFLEVGTGYTGCGLRCEDCGGTLTLLCLRC